MTIILFAIFNNLSPPVTRLVLFVQNSILPLVLSDNAVDGRTESGGLAFDAINRVMELCPGACDGSVLVVPDSSKGATR